MRNYKDNLLLHVQQSNSRLRTKQSLRDDLNEGLREFTCAKIETSLDCYTSVVIPWWLYLGGQVKVVLGGVVMGDWGQEGFQKIRSEGATPVKDTILFSRSKYRCFGKEAGTN